MGKLVLRLPDGARREFALERERLTIGRRADNDICLPFPAVSGEHAAVVTILDDSFLEDLGSTNGTLVNGKAITKHFLRDYDEIDIGRQTLVYVTGDYATPTQSPLPAGNETVAVTANGGATIGDDEATVVYATRPAAREAVSGAQATEDVRTPPIAESAVVAPSAASLGGDAPARAESPAMPSDVPVLEVLDGPNAGLMIAVAHDDFIVGRVGAQIAAVRRTSQGFRLVAIEGERPRVNGIAIPEQGATLGSGDEIEVAGTRIAYRPRS